MSIAEGSGSSYTDEIRYGMSLRDYFAARAMSITFRERGLYGEEGGDGAAARAAYQIADAMLNARERD